MSSTSLSNQQLAKLRAKIGEVDADEGRFLKYLAARWRDEGIKRLGDIPARNFDEAVAVLEAKRRDPSKPWTLDELLESFRNDSSEIGLVGRRALERVKAGADFSEAWRLALTERLGKVRREQWSRELLELTSDLVLEEYEPKLIAEWDAQHARDRRMTDQLARWLKAKGVRAYRGKAEEMCARIQHVIPNPIDQNPWAHWRSPMDMMRQG